MKRTFTDETISTLKRKADEASTKVTELRQRQETLAAELREAERQLATWQSAYSMACEEVGTLPQRTEGDGDSLLSQKNGQIRHTGGEGKMPRLNSIPTLAIEALRKAGRPMTTKEILDQLARMGKVTAEGSIDSMLVRYKHIFRRQPDAKWGLVLANA